jgi:hypothetical protein
MIHILQLRPMTHIYVSQPFNSSRTNKCKYGAQFVHWAQGNRRLVEKQQLLLCIEDEDLAARQAVVMAMVDGDGDGDLRSCSSSTHHTRYSPSSMPALKKTVKFLPRIQL